LFTAETTTRNGSVFTDHPARLGKSALARPDGPKGAEVTAPTDFDISIVRRYLAYRLSL
jgi:hypothetical protein